MSISGEWSIIFLAMFITFLMYGIEIKSIPMQFQGWLRVVFNLPVIIGFFCFGNITVRHWFLLCSSSALIGLSVFGSNIVPIYTTFIIFSTLAIVASLRQAYVIYDNKSRGRVSVSLQLIYLLSVIFWAIYAKMIDDSVLWYLMPGFIISYSSVVFMWYKYPVKQTTSN